jgi:hypothetical protein
MHNILWLRQPPKVTEALFDCPLAGGGRTVGMGRFLEQKSGEKIETDWAQMTTPGCPFLQHAVNIAEQLGVTEFIAPDPDFAGKVLSPKNLPKILPLAGDLTLRYGAAADGYYPLLPRQAYLLRSSGCPGIHVWHPGDPSRNILVRRAAGHGGLRSLLNNLPQALIEAMGLTRAECEEVRVDIIAAIHSWGFDHPTEEQKNDDLCKRVMKLGGMRCVPTFIKEEPEKPHLGQIELNNFTGSLFERQGVLRRNIRRLAYGIDNFPRHTDGSTLWYTTRNFPLYPPEKDTKEKWVKRRNLLIVAAGHE